MMSTVRRKTISAVFALALAVSIAAAGIESGDDSAEERPFPDFSLYTNTGEQWRLADQGRRPKVLMFWATWCPYCRRLFPEIQRLHEDYGHRGLAVAAISFADDGDTLSYARQHGLTMTILDHGDALAGEVGVVGTPTIFLLDSDNRVTFVTRTSDPADRHLRDAVALAVATYGNKKAEPEGGDFGPGDSGMNDF